MSQSRRRVRAGRAHHTPGRARDGSRARFRELCEDGATSRPTSCPKNDDASRLAPVASLPLTTPVASPPPTTSMASPPSITSVPSHSSTTPQLSRVAPSPRLSTFMPTIAALGAPSTGDATGTARSASSAGSAARAGDGDAGDEKRPASVSGEHGVLGERVRWPSMLSPATCRRMAAAVAPAACSWRARSAAEMRCV